MLWWSNFYLEINSLYYLLKHGHSSLFESGSDITTIQPIKVWQVLAPKILIGRDPLLPYSWRETNSFRIFPKKVGFTFLSSWISHRASRMQAHPTKLRRITSLVYNGQNCIIVSPSFYFRPLPHVRAGLFARTLVIYQIYEPIFNLRREFDSTVYDIQEYPWKLYLEVADDRSKAKSYKISHRWYRWLK